MGKTTRAYAEELISAIREADFERISDEAAAAVALRVLGVASPASVRRYLAYLAAVGAIKADHAPGVWKICPRGK